jgi:4-aminobutyrate aminotransferase-like enzyme
MAKVYTGQSGAIVADLAYHGVSEATAALSTNTYPPSARPPHVAVFPAPRPGSDGGAAARAAADALRQAGFGLALLAIDGVFSAAGILEPDTEFIRGLADQTRAEGGLFLADEVQAGFGRAGKHLWRFLDYGITPDFVTLGKPMGNGHPVAALITRREIADRFVEVDEYFSTYGGNPVSCAAALTVLDVVAESGLVEHSGHMGRLLRAGLTDVVPDTFAVRGVGLLTGVEIPRHAGVSAAVVAERLRDNGVLVGTTGPGGTVVKIRPPLVWQPEHVEFFLTRFRRAIAGLG